MKNKTAGTIAALGLLATFTGCAAPMVMQARGMEAGKGITPFSTYFMTKGDACVKIGYNFVTAMGGPQSKEKIQELKVGCNEQHGTVLIYRVMDPD